MPAVAHGHNYRNSLFMVDLAMGQIGYHVPQNVFLVVIISNNNNYHYDNDSDHNCLAF